MKARIIATALTAAATAATAALTDRLTGRDPAHRAHPTPRDATRLADLLIDQHRTGRRP
ncbi:hypothetical protein [Micromonospora sp. RP3T]|uniref:hypothetical protein n=1 Tax=Micromonospora sp. RP3T TaxID=2135446 RepID=UPI003D73D107